MDQTVNAIPEASYNGSDPCLRAAGLLHVALYQLAAQIEESGNSSIAPIRLQPVDEFIAEMDLRKSAPSIVYVPKRLKGQIWTESVTLFIYAGIEQAFTKAGMMPGGNASGHVKELNDLRAWAEQQLKEPGRPVPKLFSARTARLFSKGILRDRRQERVGLLQRIEASFPVDRSDLLSLMGWIDEDLADDLLRQKGRPAEYQKIAFAVEIANLWNTLTGKPFARGPTTYFAHFLEACWRSGFVERQLETSFKRVLRFHIRKVLDPEPCNRCKRCITYEACERERYYGIQL